MTKEGIFLLQLKRSVYYAKIRRGWAVGRLADAEREVRQAERNLKKWTKAYRPKKRKAAKK
jgi:hypothetical protein